MGDSSFDSLLLSDLLTFHHPILHPQSHSWAGKATSGLPQAGSFAFRGCQTRARLMDERSSQDNAPPVQNHGLVVVGMKRQGFALSLHKMHDDGWRASVDGELPPVI